MPQNRVSKSFLRTSPGMVPIALRSRKRLCSTGFIFKCRGQSLLPLKFDWKKLHRYALKYPPIRTKPFAGGCGLGTVEMSITHSFFTACPRIDYRR